MKEKQALDTFGQIVMSDLRDRSIDFFEQLVEGHWKSPSLEKLQAELQELNEKQINLVRSTLIRSLDRGIHDFLFKLQEQADFENDIEIKVQGVDIIQSSDGLQGELFTEDGWITNFSKYGELQEEH
ncbi:hypothetical protein [Paenibacillus silvae]|uniref:hypothetical protein n=1 Tax=Paenibacillus silvae TaxID=1325358 RepID=UPI002002F104|nr:hypothetical protein [Paenibacillus silvae]MCK6074681.1 hypothetical protein [Paenibacillus silvae]MCK6147844.1 hypothetical protein [Paenibacillus silvae]MCK6266142.1 hypothetical protein [Paenibacillus silvae]